MKRKLISVGLALVLVCSFSLVTAVPAAAGASTEYTREGSTVEVTSLAEPYETQTPEAFDAEPETLVLDAAAFDAQTNPVTIAGAVSDLTLGAGWPDTAYVEIGLRPEATKTGRNAGIYLIAFNTPTTTQIHLQDYTGGGRSGGLINLPSSDSAFSYEITLTPHIEGIGGTATLDVWDSDAKWYGPVTLSYGCASTWEEDVPGELNEDFSDAYLFYSIIAECRGAPSLTYSATVGDITITSTDLYNVELDSDWYRTGEVVNVTVNNPLANDPMREDVVDVTAVSSTDTFGITLTLNETDFDTGVFEGSFGLVAEPVPPPPATIVVNDGGLITVEYLDVTDTATVDDTVPVITIVSPADGETVTTAMPTISATLADAASGINEDTIVMVLDIDTVVAAYDSGTGALTYTPAGVLAQGEHTVTVDVDDVAGNPAEPVSWSFTVDSEKPIIEGISLAPGPPYIYTEEGTIITFTLTFSEPMNPSFAPDATFGLPPGFDTHTVTGSWTADTEWVGTFQIPDIASWDSDRDGEQTLFITDARDPAGNVMVSDTSTTFVIDLHAPDAPYYMFVFVNENPPLTDDTVEGEFEAVEGGSLVEVWNDAIARDLVINRIGSTTANDNGSFDPISIGDNIYGEVWVTAADDFGNRSTATPLLNDIDSPEITSGDWFVKEGKPTWILEGQVIDVIIIGEPGCTATFDIVGIDTGVSMTESDSYHGSYIVVAGDNVKNAPMRYRLEDAAGNKSELAIPMGPSIDTMVPTIDIDSVTPVPDSFVNTSGPEISAVLHDNLSGIDPESIVMTVDDGSVTGGVDFDDGVVYFILDSALSEGGHEVALAFSDVAGNPARKVIWYWYFTVDTVYPVITIYPVTTPTDVDTQKITGKWTEENLDTMTLTVNGNLVEIDFRTDIWGTVVDAVLQEGDNLIVATITDKARNSASAEATINLDRGDPVVTVISPNGGESWQSGNMYNITWTALDPNFINSPITIEYSIDGGSSWNDVAMAEPNDGGYLWAVPKLDSSDCLVRVTGTDLLGHSGSDVSDTAFTITTSAPDTIAPAVTVNSPNGGESWQGGSTQTITWTATDDKTPGGDLVVMITYSSNGGTDWQGIDYIEFNMGAYSWTVPEINSSQCLVMVGVVDTSGNVGSDISDKVFTITTPGEPITSIQLKAGWNLISLMLIPTSSNITDVLAGIPVESVKSVWAYDASTENWSSYAPGAPGDLETMVDGKGYWVEMNSLETLVIEGQKLPDPPAALPAYSVVEGWNLIGFKSTIPRAANSYLLAIDGKYTLVRGYEATYFTVGAGGNLNPGYGYWISITESGTIYP